MSMENLFSTNSIGKHTGNCCSPPIRVVRRSGFVRSVEIRRDLVEIWLDLFEIGPDLVEFYHFKIRPNLVEIRQDLFEILSDPAKTSRFRQNLATIHSF